MTAALVCAATVVADPSVGNPKPDARSQITGFMDSYARDLVKRLGAGTRIEYDKNSVAVNAEARPCAIPLAITAQNQQSLGRVTLLVACGNEWSVYTPVDLNVYRPVVVATKPLASGAVIANDDVALNPLEVGQLTGTYLTTLDEAVGMGVKRPIAPGKPLLAQQLEQPLLIRRGEGVMISAENGELAVKMSGTALTDGRRGEHIRIKNQTSTRVIDARVTAPGQVTVSM